MGLQVHTKVHHFPFNTFTHVFFLFKDEHVVVEELLQFFVGEVDAKLFKGVEIEDLETSNIQDTAEVASWKISIKSSVTHLHKPLEELVKDSFGNSTSGTSTLGNVLTLGDHLSTDLDTWSGESLAHISRRHTEQVGDFVGNVKRCQFSLLISWLLNVHLVNNNHTLAGPVVVFWIVTDHTHFKYLWLFG